MSLEYQIELDREEDGRWIAEITKLPGVLAYGATREEAIAAAEALALRVIADRIDVEKSAPMPLPSRPREQVAKFQSEECLSRVVANRLVAQISQEWLPCSTAKTRSPGFYVGISRRRRDWSSDAGRKSRNTPA